MFQGIFKSAIKKPDTNTNYIFGTGSIPIQIKTAQLATFADGTTKQQGYQVAEVNKLISTMLTGWDANGNKPKSMSDNYLELILSCDNGFVVKKRLQFPHIIAWQDDNTPYNIADVYKEFSIDNWLKADDFENPDITLVVEPTDEILTTSTATPPEVTTTNSGRFYLYYRNLPIGVNHIHIDFHIKTKTEPIDFDLEVVDGLSWKDAQVILASNAQAKLNILLSSVKDVYKFTGAEGDFDEITMHEWNALYQQIISLNPSNKFTHDLFFILYESEIETKITELDKKVRDIKNSIQDLDGDILYITDGNGNVIASVDQKGLHSTNMLENQWHGKVIATYGDSVTALNDGDYDPKSKESDNAKWARKVAKYFSFAKLNNRGIGSTTYMYPNNGGMIAWVDKATGEYVNRDDNHSYKDYEDNPSFIPTGTDYVGSREYDATKHNLIRGCGCSWLRITSMFKESFKDSVDVVLVMYHNDFHQDMSTEAEWVEGSVVDKEWAQSEYYSTYNGDYNIDCVKGGIASVITKLQAWMPQALIVLMTPISGVHDTTHEDDKNIENPESTKMRTLAEVVKDTAFKMSIPCIDVYGTDSINSLNRNIRNYITDNIHPYSDEGCKVIARAIISQMINLIPNL